MSSGYERDLFPSLNLALLRSGKQGGLVAAVLLVSLREKLPVMRLKLQMCRIKYGRLDAAYIGVFPRRED